MTESREDARLVVLAQAGDADALSSLYSKYQGLARVWAMHLLRHWDAAVEVGDAGAAKMLEQLRNWRPTGLFRSWMYRMVKNLVVEHVRRRKFAPVGTSLDVLDELLPTDTEPVGLYAASRVREAVAGLATELRQVVEARFFVRESFVEFARRTHTSERVARYRFNQAMRVLRRRLSWFRVKIPCRISPAQALSY
jgi:RNA polymerase sigma factor (sigma-70 family)